MYRLLKSLFFLLFFLVILYFISLPLKDYLENSLKSLIAEKTGFKVHYKTLSWYPLLRFTLTDVTLEKNDGTHLSVERIYCKPSANRLLKGSITLKALYLKNVSISLPASSIPSDGVTSSLSIRELLSLPIEIYQLRIDGFQLNNHNPQLPLPKKIVLPPDLLLTGNLRYTDTLPHSWSLEIQAQDLANPHVNTTHFELSSYPTASQQEISFSMEEKSEGILIKELLQGNASEAYLKIFAAIPSNVSLQNMVAMGRFETSIKGHTASDWEYDAVGNFHLKEALDISFKGIGEHPFPNEQSANLHIDLSTGNSNIQLDTQFDLDNGKTLNIQGVFAGLISHMQGSISLSVPEEKLFIESQTTISQLKEIQLQDLQASWEQSFIQGDLAIELFPYRLQGVLHTKQINWGSVHFEGQKGKIEFYNNNHSQQIFCTLSASQVDFSSLKMKDFLAQLQVNQLFTSPEWNLNVQTTEAFLNDVPLGALEFSTSSIDENLGHFHLYASKATEPGWDVHGYGNWAALSPSKVQICLENLEGNLAARSLKMQKKWEVFYFPEKISFSPFLCQIDEGLLYLGLEKKNDKHNFSFKYLNLSSDLLKILFESVHLPFNPELSNYWNFKSQVLWDKEGENVEAYFFAMPKHTTQTTAIQFSLNSSGLTLKAHHPAEGLLTLFSPTYKDFHLDSEARFQAPSYRLFDIIDPSKDLTLNGLIRAHIQKNNQNQIFSSHIIWKDRQFTFDHIHLKNDLFNAEGSFTLDPLSLVTSGKFNLETYSYPSQGTLNVIGPLAEINYKFEGKGSPIAENFTDLFFTVEGTVSFLHAVGVARGQTTYLNHPVSANFDYKLDLNTLSFDQLDLEATYQDSSKVNTRLGDLLLKASVQGSLGAFQGKATLSATKTKIEEADLPNWRIETDINFPNSQETFSIFLDNQVFGQGFWNANVDSFALQLNQAKKQISGEIVSLKQPWKIEWKNHQVSFSPLALSVGRGSFDLQGNASLENFQLQFQGKRLPIALPFPKDYSLPLQGQLQISGIFSGPWSSPSGQMRLTTRRLQFKDKFFGKSPDCQLKMDALISPSVTSIRGQIACTGIEPMTFSGKFPTHFSLIPFDLSLNVNAPIEAQMQGTGSLGPIIDIFFSSSHSVKGSIQLLTQVRGTFAHPELTGRFHLRDGSLENIDTGTAIKNIEATARLTGQSVNIEQISASDGRRGTLKGNGQILLGQNFSFKMRGFLDKLLLIQTDFVHSEISGEIIVSGDTSQAVIQGSVETVSPEIDIREEIPEGTDSVAVIYVNTPPGRKTKTTLETPTENTEYPVHLDLSLKTGNKLSIHGRGLDSSWKGQVHLTGPITNPSAQGELKIDHGSYLFKGKNFEIRQGTITFSGPWETKTKLYVIGSLEIDDIVIEAILRGALKNPSLAFRSNPPLPQREIVSHLLFGKGISEITPFQGDLLSQSISNISATNDSPDFLSKVRSRLRLDRLDIHRKTTSQGDAVSLQVGKYISKGVYVSLNKNITEEGNSISIDAKVTQQVKVQAEITDKAETQLLLKWKHDF